MEKLDIIARPMLCEENKDRNTENEIDMYFVPAVLKEIITTDQLSRIEKYASITPNMYFDFQNRFLSPSVFHRLIAACLKKWDIAYQENIRLLFCGCGIFDVDKSRTTRIMISIEKYRIKARILYYQNRFALPGYCKQSVEIKQFVEETLENVFGRYQQKVPYKLLIECRPSGGELIPVDCLMQFPSINCTGHDTCHIVISRQLLEYWFSSEEYEHLEDNGEAINLNYWLNDHRPSDKQLGSIAETIGSDFFSLAFKLDLNYTEIIEIEKKYPGQLLRQCAEMLFKWRDKGDRKTKTLGNLYEAMCLVGCDIQGLLKVCSR